MINSTSSGRRPGRSAKGLSVTPQAPQPPAPSPPRGDIVAATFANAELSTARAALDSYYTQYVEAQAEKEMLRDELRQHQEDSLQVISHLETQLAGVLAASAEYKTEVTAVLRTHQNAEKALRQRHEEAMQERDKQIAEYAELTRCLQDDLRQASKYVLQRQEHAMELKQLHEELEEMAVRHEKELTALRFQTVDRKMKLVSMEQVMRNEFQAMVETESERLLGEKFAAVVQYNRVLEEEKYSMAGDIEDLMALTGTITAEKDVLRRRADLHRQGHEEVLRHAVARSRQHREREVKVQRLEARVRELLAQQRTLRDTLRAQYGGRITALEEALAHARAAAQAHRTELRQLRRLATHVVGQRTGLERFFYTAVEDCRRYRAGLDTLAGATTITAPQLPPLLPTSTVAASSRAGSTRFKRTPLSQTHAADTFRITQPSLADPLPRETTAGVRARASGTERSCFVTQDDAADAGPPQRGPSTHLPTRHDAYSGTATAVPSSGVYVEELYWEDKEKVIKALLFYINSTYYKEAPLAADEEADTDASLPEPPATTHEGGAL